MLKDELKKLFAPLATTSWRASVYAAVALALMLVYLYQGHRSFFITQFAPTMLPGASAMVWEWWGVLYQFGAIFLLFLVVPALLLKLVAGERLRELGLGLGDVRAGWVVVVLGLLLIALPAGLVAAADPAFLREYPLSKLAAATPGRFVLYELGYGIFYYIAWEAFFRGFLQLSLRPHLGAVGALLFQTAASTLLHIGKPGGEIWASLAAGFGFGLLVYRTRSIWPLVIVHWGLGFFTDLFCALKAGLFQ